ncbi:MAG: GHKL domain-containing protein, partial [Syntrophomonadaceae bacterium]
MLFELQRLVLMVIPYVLCSTIAALIIWGEKVKDILPRLLLFTLLSSITQTATYQISIELYRFPLEVASGLLVAFLVFRKQIQWVVKIYVTSYILGIGVMMASTSIYLAFFKHLVYHDIVIWLYVALPADLFMLLIAWLIHQGKISFKYYAIRFRESLSSLWPVYVAVFIQLIVFQSVMTDLASQVIMPVKTYVIWVASTILYGVSIFIMARFIRTSQQEIQISVQENIADNIKELIDSVKGQRHDFLNHLQVIYGLCQEKQYESLGEYVKELGKETAYYNELLTIDNPVLSALISAKTAQANERGISLKMNINADLKSVSHVSIELARILGNLIDNALDAVENQEERYIKLDIDSRGALLIVSVSNPWCGDISSIDKAINQGISTKGGEHQGLGLHICKQLANKIHAHFSYSYEPSGELCFTLAVP